MSSVRKRTNKYFEVQIYTKKFVPRGHLCENMISTCKPSRRRVCEYTSCTKTCHASQACSKTQIFYTNTYNHDAFCTKTCKHLKIDTKKQKTRGHLYDFISTCKPIRKHICQETSCMETCNASQPFRKHNYSIRKRIITMPSVRKRTNI